MKKITTSLLFATISLLLILPSCKKGAAVTQNFDCTDLSYITTNTTIQAGTYYVTCNIEVSNSASLTIAPGTTLVFSQGNTLTIDAGASISAVGTSSSPIVFKGSQATQGYWGGIFINSISLLNQFTYCTIRDGGAPSGNQFNANVTLGNATAGFTNCTITNSADAGLYLMGSNDQTIFNSFQNNSVTGNGSYPIITYLAGAGSIASTNTFSGNPNNYIGIPTEDGVTVNVTLSALPIPYLFLQLGGSDDGVSVTKTLTIQPGVTIAMGSAISLYTTATGTINAVGTSSNPIIIKGLQSTAGFWGGLNVQSPNANQFIYCNISDGGGIVNFGINGNNTGLVGTYMYIPTARTITVRNCKLSNSASAGIWVRAADGTPLPTYNSDITTSNTFTGCSPNVQY